MLELKSNRSAIVLHLEWLMALTKTFDLALLITWPEVAL